MILKDKSRYQQKHKHVAVLFARVFTLWVIRLYKGCIYIKLQKQAYIHVQCITFLYKHCICNNYYLFIRNTDFHNNCHKMKIGHYTINCIYEICIFFWWHTTTVIIYKSRCCFTMIFFTRVILYFVLSYMYLYSISQFPAPIMYMYIVFE